MEPASDAPLPIDPCIARLDDAIDAAKTLGLPTDDAAGVREDAAARLGFPADAYVVALVGGTGVGKSSLLNALAGSVVSPASALRPTTARPVALVESSLIRQLEPLLEWLDVDPGDVRPTDGTGLRDVAVLDLPDLDSTSRDHRARVEAALPRVDAVIWVTDPEKYADAVLHDDFFARWLPRLSQQIVVVNKADRLTPADRSSVRRDLERDLGRVGGAVAGRPPVILTSAANADGSAAIDELRDWLHEQAEAKVVIRGRLVASIQAAVRGLARAAGVTADASPEPMLAASARQRAIESSTAALLRVVDLPRLEDQAVRATRARARARGAGPLGGLTALIYRWSGRQARVADPVGFLARWRDRGSLSSAVEPIRAAMSEPLRSAPVGTRSALSEAVRPEAVERRLGAAVDRAVAAEGRDVPTSAFWTIIGLLQSLATLALVVVAIWVLLWVLVKFPVDSIPVPLVGRAPAPFVALIATLAVGYLLARILGLHAGRVGRHWARRVAAAVRSNVEREVDAAAFTALEPFEIARRRLWEAARAAAGEDCRT